ncbi:MAG TPA: HAD family hydrolase [Thermotoga sp.]|nr:HAD family hydrolase [Thermotoga sp.]
MGSYKVFVFDLDGTLMNDNEEIPEKNVEALKKLIKRFEVVIASGRMLISILKVEKKYFGIELPTIAYNGGMIYIPGEGIVFEKNLETVLAREILQDLRKMKIHRQIYINDTLYVEEDNEKVREYAKHSDVDYYVVKDLLALIEKKGPTKILAIDEENVLDVIKKNLREKYKNGVKIFKSFPTYLEFVPQNVDKGVGLRYLRKRFNWKKEEIVSFGDNENDIAMFRESGLKVAVANAVEDLKEVADIVSPSNNQAGIADVLFDLVDL